MARRLLIAGVMRIALSLLAGLGLAATTGAAHAAPHLTLSRGMSPHPHVTAKLEVPTDDVRTYARGWTECDPGGGNFTTKAPSLTFEVTEAMPLRIRMENALGDTIGGGGVIVFPDGTYMCDDDKNQFFMKSWPRGRYQLYFNVYARKASAHIRFEDPERSARELKAALAALPAVRLGADGDQNPRFQEVPATVAVDYADVGPTCGKPRQRMMPLARLEVTRASSWYVASGGETLYVITPDDRCVNPADGGALAAGSYVLWTVVPREQPPARYPLEIDDRRAALALPPAALREAGALDAPLVVDGVVRPAERWYQRDGACRGAARAPDFYLRATQPHQQVTLSLLWSPVRQRVHVFGPLERIDASSDPRCAGDHDDEHRFDVLEGTYAVWIGGPEAAAGSAYHLLILKEGVTVDPLTTLAPIPEQLDVAARAYRNHYPYFRAQRIADWTALWTTVPDRLFVYTRTAVTVDGDELPAGEPLLVSAGGGSTVNGVRYDGSSVRVDARLITTERPAAVVLPARPALPNVESLSRARDLAGPGDQPAIAKHAAQARKFDTCFGDYMAKHDPTWGHGHDVYRISGSRVVNVGDQVAAAAGRKCGEKKLEAAERALMKQLEKTRTARYVAHLAAVRERFGI